jgi:hypothetical protein
MDEDAAHEREWRRRVAEEHELARRARAIADLTLAVIRQDPRLTPREAGELAEAARRTILDLFPDKEEVYRMIYAPRFARAIAERWPDPDPRSAPARRAACGPRPADG